MEEGLAQQIWKDQETLDFVAHILKTTGLSLVEALQREFFLGKQEYGEFDAHPTRVVYGAAVTLKDMKARWYGGEFCHKCLRGVYHTLDCPDGPWAEFQSTF